MLDEYQGTYRLSSNFLLNAFRVNDQLMVQATGQSPVPLLSSAKDEFFASVAPISISFKRDADGKVDSLVLHQNGDHNAAKLSVVEADALRGNKEIVIDPSTFPRF